MKRLSNLSALWLILFVFIHSTSVYPQDVNRTWDELVMDEEIDWEAIEEQMADLHLQQLSVHTLTKEELEQFPFLSDKMIENILYFIFRYGPVNSIQELQGVEGMSRRVLEYLRPYLVFDKIPEDKKDFSWKEWLKYPKIQLITKLKIPLQASAGYADFSPEQLVKSPDKKYLGANFYHNFRSRISFSQHVNIGVHMEKDEGEPLFEKYAKGYDFLSAYFQLKKWGKWQQLIIGDFRLAYGYGLTMNSHFYLGKNLSSNGFHRMAKGVSPSNSLQEQGFFRGIGGEYAFNKRLTYTFSASYTPGDASVDSVCITAFKTDGKHRLISELKKKHDFYNLVFFNGIYYNGKFYEGGFTAVYNHFNRILNPPLNSYNQFAPRGNDFWNVSGLYKLYLNRWIVSGELSMDRMGRIAWQNRMSFRWSVDNSLFFMNRYYDKKYQSIFGNTFRENSTLNNEIGFLIGLENNHLRNINWLITSDVFYFPDSRYRVSKAGTWGVDMNIRVNYSPSNSLELLIKGGYKMKYRDYRFSENEKWVIPHGRGRLSVEMRNRWEKDRILKTQVQWVRAHDSNIRCSDAYLLNVNWSGLLMRRWRLTCSGAWFMANDYDARMYMYEPGLLYSYSGMWLYGKGWRGAGLLHYEWSDRWSVQLKWGWTHYFDRNRIGTGTEEIRGKNRSDVQLQLRYVWKKSPLVRHEK